MVLKLYGHPMTTCTQRVEVICKELGVEYELIVVEFATREHNAPEYLSHQPFGQLPYLDDNGFILFESRAIARYISAKYGGGKLVPQGVEANAKFEQAVSIESSNFDPFADEIVYEKLAKKMQGRTADEARVSLLTVQLDKKLDGYEAILSKQKFLAGNELTLADLFHLPYGSLLVPSGVGLLEDASKRPNLARWWKEVSSLPNWVALKSR